MTVSGVDPLTASIDLSSGRGIEVGALHSPRVRKVDGNVRYVDHATREDLVKKYESDPNLAPHIGDIVETDYVWKPGTSLRECLADWAPVDYVVGSHVFEHIADPVSWLKEISDVLVPGGVASFAIPDKRYCFDARRATSTLAQVVDLFVRKVEKPTCQQIFDHGANYLASTTIEDLWDGVDAMSVSRGPRGDPERIAYAICLRAQEDGEYVDVHATVHTPESLLDILEGLIELELLDFNVGSLIPTRSRSHEFHLTLVRCEDGPPAERLRGQRSSIDTARQALALVSRPQPSQHPPGTGAFETSALEQRLILAKRRILWELRKPARTFRR